jgi:hypothetical protein
MAPDPKRFPPSGHVFVFMVVNIALWAYMAFWSYPYLRRISGGLAPFDLRPFGYSVEEARALLFALSQIGRDYYANIQLSLDNAFPATYALSRGLLLLWLTLPGRTSNRPIPWGPRLAVLALPTVTAAFDYLENDGIAAMLAAGPQVDADVVARASLWTQVKSFAALVTELTCVILAAIAFMRRRHRRGEARAGRTDS